MGKIHIKQIRKGKHPTKIKPWRSSWYSLGKGWLGKESPNPEISFPPIDEEEGAEGPMIIEAEVGGHFIHHMYVDGGSASDIMYEHCFNKLLPEVKSRMVPSTASLIGFSGEIIWPLGQMSLLVKIGDAEHSTSTFMNFVVVRSASPYNGIIGRPEIRKL
ncbi:reverse transcriptase domain-containing protein [Tanacetum coccineum]